MKKAKCQSAKSDQILFLYKKMDFERTLQGKWKKKKRGKSNKRSRSQTLEGSAAGQQF
jgi:hypothetical protein